MSATGIICYSSVKITTSDNFKSKYTHGHAHTDNSDVDGDLLMLIVIDFDFQLPQIYGQFGRLFRLGSLLLSISAIRCYVALLRILCICIFIAHSVCEYKRLIVHSTLIYVLDKDKVLSLALFRVHRLCTLNPFYPHTLLLPPEVKNVPYEHISSNLPFLCLYFLS